MREKTATQHAQRTHARTHANTTHAVRLQAVELGLSDPQDLDLHAGDGRERGVSGGRARATRKKKSRRARVSRRQSPRPHLGVRRGRVGGSVAGRLFSAHPSRVLRCGRCWSASKRRVTQRCAILFRWRAPRLAKRRHAIASRVWEAKAADPFSSIERLWARARALAGDRRDVDAQARPALLGVGIKQATWPHAAPPGSRQ